MAILHQKPKTNISKRIFKQLNSKNFDKYNLFNISSNMNNYTSFHITITSDNLSRSISNRVDLIPTDTLSKIIPLMQNGKNFKTNRIEFRFCSNLKHNSFMILQTYSKFTLLQFGHQLFIFLKISLLNK